MQTVAIHIYFNAVVFNSTVMERMVVARLRLDKQTTENLNFTRGSLG